MFPQLSGKSLRISACQDELPTTITREWRLELDARARARSFVRLIVRFFVRILSSWTGEILGNGTE